MDSVHFFQEQWLLVASLALGMFLLFWMAFSIARPFLEIRADERLSERFGELRPAKVDRFANCFGLQSRGVTQARGNGVLALTDEVLWFSMAVPRRETEIPLSAITGVTTPKNHLYKTQGAPLLHVAFQTDNGPDAVAWRVADLPGWLAALRERLPANVDVAAAA